MDDLPFVEVCAALQARASRAEETAKQLYDKNVTALAHILRLTKEKQLQEESFERHKETLNARIQQLLEVVDAQQGRLDNLAAFSRLRSVWKSLLPLHNHASAELSQTDLENMSYALTLISAKYIEELEATVESPRLASADSSPESARNNTTFISCLLEEVRELQANVSHLDYMEADNVEMRCLLQERSAELSQLREEATALRSRSNQDAMRCEDLRQALMLVTIHVTCAH